MFRIGYGWLHPPRANVETGDLEIDIPSALLPIAGKSNFWYGCSVHISRTGCLVIALLAVLACPLGAQTVFVPPGSIWKYLDDGSNQGTAWHAIGFEDSAWRAGPAELGYGDDSEGRPERTVISFGTNASSKYITSYFRHRFTVPSTAGLTNLLLGVMRDDGVVVYLNGAEVFRDNLPAGTITYSTTAPASVSGADESAFHTANVHLILLRPGTNVLAAEVHQNSATSSDLSFDLYLAGFTATPATDRLLFYVSTNGQDNWTGTVPQPAGNNGPFATLERARDVVRFYALNGYLPPGGALIEVGGGVYAFDRALDLTAQDTGTPESPIVWRARPGETVRLTGGKFVHGFWRVTDEAILARLDPSARGRVWAADLRAQGITNFIPPQPGPSWANSDPGLELFFNDQPMTLARWPNEGYVRIVQALGPTPVDIRGTTGTAEGIFSYEGDRPSRWVGEPDVMVHGFWFWDWADQRHRVLSIDTVSNIITVATPYHTYGYRDGQWYYAYNLLCELDQPGEWYLDRQAGILYFWPPSSLTEGLLMVSQSASLLTLTDASHMTFQGFIFEGCQGTGITISGGATNCLRACTIRNIGKTGLRISNSPGSGVTGCDIYFTGDGGIALSGGDRPTLTPAGLYAENNHIHHFARWNPIYKPGVSLGGVGNRAVRNLIHDAPHEGIAFGGNDHLIELNEFHSLVNDSNDAGVIYAGRTWTARGHVIRYNYFHHIYGFERRGCIGVYLDDQFSSALVYGNLFYDVPTAVLVGGGRDNYLLNNIFVQCKTSISIDARGLGWAASGFTGLSNELVSLPYQTPPWSTRYPELTNILNQESMAPRGNVVAQNISWAGGWTQIETGAQPGVVLSNNLVGVDPAFVDTNRLDFRLENGSPAFALGFQPLPLDQIGPQTNLEHAPWPPTVTLVRPLHHALFGSPATVVMEAIVSDPARVTETVQFLVGNARLGGTAEFPFRYSWSNVPPGSYSINARALYDGGVAGTPRPAVIQVSDTLVPAGSVWKYLDNGSNQGTPWRGISFNDVLWKSGPAELGYGDSTDGRPETTVISYGPNSSSKYITYYFRHVFRRDNPASYTNLVLGLLRDDGAVVYLNGDEIFRSNLTNAAISYLTPALTAVSGADEATFYQIQLDPALLRPGTNVLAVEVHQVNGQSSDVSFDLYLHGFLKAEPLILQAERDPAGVKISWPLSGAEHVLQAALRVPAADWDATTNLPSVDQARVSVTVDTAAVSRFFRLAKP
jgi:hypothetical protein